MRLVCIYHSRDLDGWMSAAIVKKWFIRQYNADQHNSMDYLGWDYGDEIPDVSKYDKVIMCDVSFPAENMEAIADGFVEFNNPVGPFNDRFVWCDHHISAIKASEDIYWWLDGIRDTNFAACELTWNHFFPNEEMPEIVRLLGRYDCFGGKGTDEWQKILEFQYGAREEICNYEEAYLILEESIIDESIGYIDVIGDIHRKGQSIYKYLCKEAESVIKNAFKVQFIEDLVYSNGHKQGERVIRNFLCVNKVRFNPVSFGVDYHNLGYDGFACFHMTKDNKWAFSVYNEDGRVDCSEIAKRFNGGGHKGAAGFIVDDLREVF